MDMTALALAYGFTCAAPVDPRALAFRPEVREMCRSGRCGSYGKNWCCPPACSSLEEMSRTMEDYDTGVLIQTVAQLEDDFDYETMMDAQRRHKENLERLVDELHRRAGAAAVLPMGAGTCTRCKTCTYPDAPCRFPEKRLVSMEAYGLLVSQVCETAGVPYYHGPGTLAYVSCVFLRADAEENKTDPVKESV